MGTPKPLQPGLGEGASASASGVCWQVALGSWELIRVRGSSRDTPESLGPTSVVGVPSLWGFSHAGLGGSREVLYLPPPPTTTTSGADLQALWGGRHFLRG